jgi:WD40 repeat protein
MDWIFSVTFSPDGKRIASGAGLGDRTIRICDAETGDIVSGPLEGHTGPIYSVAFSSDGKHLVSSSQDRTIRVWAVEISGSISNQLDENNNLIESGVFPPGGQYIASTSSFRILSNQGDNLEGGFGDSSKLEGGWILNSASRLLFWVPPWSRTGLWRPRNTAIIGDLVTKLDLTNFVHGDTWQQCIQ